MRVRRWSTVVGFIVLADALGACSLISGIGEYTKGGDLEAGQAPLVESGIVEPPPQVDAGPPDVTTQVDAPPTTEDEIDASQNDDFGAEEEPAEAAPEMTDAGPAVDAPIEAEMLPVDSGGPEVAPPPVDSGTDAAPDSGCKPVTHTNGAGATWVDCTPYGTHNETQAKAACQAEDAGTCGNQSLSCGINGKEQVMCETAKGECACWAYSGTVSGTWNVVIGSCTCPGVGNATMTWN